MNFTPHETYDGLRIQARALVALVESMERELTLYHKEPLARHDKHYIELQQQIESERDMNSSLTTELNIANEKIKEYERQLKCGELVSSFQAACQVASAYYRGLNDGIPDHCGC